MATHEVDARPAVSNRRKWHPRVFDGCVQCRRRHVKCDGARPSCTHCTRLSLDCSHAQGVVFRVTGPQNYRPSRKTACASNAGEGHQRQMPTALSANRVSCCPATTARRLSKPSEDDSAAERPTPGYVFRKDQADSRSCRVAAIDVVSDFDHPFSFQLSTPSSQISCSETIYYGHFMTTVSALLIVYDTPSNANPFRMLPDLLDASNTLQTTMTALGALHLSCVAATRGKDRHRRTAIEMYSSVVSQLRSNVADPKSNADLSSMATNLLLCLFEMMFASDGSWKTHLAGARRAFEALFTPQSRCVVVGTEGGTIESKQAMRIPMRRFLVSLMSYLDVAASCATGEGTLIEGDYWESFAGSWEYNLGAPSFSPPGESADRTLAQLRHAWSKLMSIQSGISSFAKLRKAGLDSSLIAIHRDTLSYRISAWHDVKPSIFTHLTGLDHIPPSATKRDVEVLTAAACVESYARACTIYLDRIVTQKLGSASEDPELALTVDKILNFTMNFSSGIHRVASLWPMFMAGAATRDVAQQAMVRDYFMNIANYGLNNVKRAWDILEYVWLQQRLFQDADYQKFEELASMNLLP